MSDEPVHRRRVEGCTAPECLERVCAALTELWEDVPAVPERDRQLFETALAEVVGNVVSHASSGEGFEAYVEVEVGPGLLLARSVDNGAEAVIDLRAPMPALGAEHGRGMPLARAALHDLRYERRDHRNVWSLRRRWSPEPPDPSADTRAD
jgi:serine/threonine-protein kinase RsbW